MTERKVPHYRIGEALGGGSMGRVYKAEHTLLQRTDALKFLSDELVSNQKAIRRFLSEAQMLAGLEHRNICRVYDIGQASDGTWYIAMAYYEGGTLKHLLDDGPLDTARALEFARQTALGLAYAHGEGIVHRDIKPANLIVTSEETSGEDRVKILDFGVARLLGSTQYTAPGAVVGTFGYLAPEQTRGDEITIAADIWSVGVVLFEMLTGTLPFPGDSHGAQLYAIAHNEPATLPVAESELDQGCAAIIDRCLQKDPADRFATAHDLAAALGAVRGSQDPTIWFPDSDSGPPSPPRRWLVALLTTLVVLAAVFLGPGLLEYFGIGGKQVDRSGVAVLPFNLVGPAEEAGPLGHGLAWYVNDRLTSLDGLSDAFWVVPPEELARYGAETKEEVRTQMGAWRVVSGTGGLSGSNIDLRLAILDHRTGESRESDFHGSTANLRTWQDDLVAWIARELDPDLTAEAMESRSEMGTTVPAAFMSYCRGRGGLQMAGKAGGEDSHRRALGHLRAAVAADSSFARARAAQIHQEWLGQVPRDSLGSVAAAARLDTVMMVDPALLRTHLYRGHILAAAGDAESALAAYDRGLTLAPAHALLMLGRASVLATLERFEEAEATHRSHIAASPGSMSGHRSLGYFYYYSVGDFAKAREEFLRATALAPGGYWGYMDVGAAIAWGDLDGDAEEWFRRSLAVEENEGTYSNLGTLYYYESRMEDAVLAYKRALILSPDDESYVHQLAEAYRWSPGFEDSARVIYARAIELLDRDLGDDPENVEMIANLASYHSLLGHDEQARGFLARLETLPPPRGDDAITVAAVYEDLGLREEALAMLERALTAGGSRRVIEDYPGFRNLRADPRYRELMERFP